MDLGRGSERLKFCKGGGYEFYGLEPPEEWLVDINPHLNFMMSTKESLNNIHGQAGGETSCAPFSVAQDFMQLAAPGLRKGRAPTFHHRIASHDAVPAADGDAADGGSERLSGEEGLVFT